MALLGVWGVLLGMRNGLDDKHKYVLLLVLMGYGVLFRRNSLAED